MVCPPGALRSYHHSTGMYAHYVLSGIYIRPRHTVVYLLEVIQQQSSTRI